MTLMLVRPYAMVRLNVCWANPAQSRFCYDLAQVHVHIIYVMLVEIDS